MKTKKTKEKKSKKEEIIKNNLEIIPIRHFDKEHDCFILEDNSCMDILSIIPRDTDNMAEDELKREIYGLIRDYKLIGSDIKFVSMKFPLNCSCQKNILKHHKERATDEARLLWINRQIDELERVETNIHSSKFYLFYFGEDIKDFIKTKENIYKYLCVGIDKLCEGIESFQKIQILNQICNMNNVFDLHYFDNLESEGENEE